MRPWAAKIVLVGLVAGLFACRTQLLDPGAADLRTTSDGGSPDGFCSGSHLSATPAAISSLVFLDPVNELALGRAVRVRVFYPLRAGCDRPGLLERHLATRNGTDEITLTAHVFRADAIDLTCGTSSLHEERVVLSELNLGGPSVLTRPKLVFLDGASPGIELASAELAPRTGQCTDTQAGFCSLDCQCATRGPQSYCSTDRHGTSSNGCFQNCSTAVDCGLSAGVTCSSDGFCVLGSPCASDGDCGFGQRCRIQPAGSACVPAQTVAPRAPCGCDADCGLGGVCLLGPLGGQCALPCTSTAGCPAQMGCFVRGCDFTTR